VKFRIEPAVGQKTVDCGELAVFADCRQWISKGCKYTFDVKPDERVRDEEWKLTDWDDSPTLYAQVGWKDILNPVHVTLDLGRVRRVDRIEAAFLRSDTDEPARKNILGGFIANLPKSVAVEYSADGHKYSQMKPAVPTGFGRNAPYTYGLALAGVKARYLRLTINPQPQGWTMISEFRALGE
jgi:hypothetical protein